MLPYFIFKEQSSHDFEILVNKLPPIQIAKEEGNYIKIPGRSGYLFQSDNSFAETNKEIIITLRNLEKLEEIKQWLTGEGKLILSSESEVFYFARIEGQVDYSKLIINRYKSTTITFICQPHGYIRNVLNVTLTSEGQLYNPGTYKSKPILKLYGTGDITLTINTRNILLKNITDYVTLNSEIEEAYRDLTSMNNQMEGDFPEFDTKMNQISWTGNVTKLEISPNWRNR